MDSAANDVIEFANVALKNTEVSGSSARVLPLTWKASFYYKMSRQGNMN